MAGQEESHVAAALQKALHSRELENRETVQEQEHGTEQDHGTEQEHETEQGLKNCESGDKGNGNCKQKFFGSDSPGLERQAVYRHRHRVSRSKSSTKNSYHCALKPWAWRSISPEKGPMSGDDANVHHLDGAWSSSVPTSEEDREATGNNAEVTPEKVTKDHGDSNSATDAEGGEKSLRSSHTDAQGTIKLEGTKKSMVNAPEDHRNQAQIKPPTEFKGCYMLILESKKDAPMSNVLVNVMDTEAKTIVQQFLLSEKQSNGELLLRDLPGFDESRKCFQKASIARNQKQKSKLIFIFSSIRENLGQHYKFRAVSGGSFVDSELVPTPNSLPGHETGQPGYGFPVQQGSDFNVDQDAPSLLMRMSESGGSKRSLENKDETVLPSKRASVDV